MTLFHSVATVNIWASDHSKAVDWYTELLDLEPYFERPGYAEFRFGDHATEFGIIDSHYASHMTFPGAPAGIIVYWHVDDVMTVLGQLQRMGATELEPPKDRGNNFVTATVIDPFGNIIGIMHNPHYVNVMNKQ